MKNFFALIGILVVVFIGIGVWQGWFKFAVNSDNKVTTEFDVKKAGEDVKQGWEHVKTVGQEKLEDLKKKDGEGEAAPAPAITPGPLVK